MGKVREQLDVVFKKEMDRKNFLKYGGSIILGVLGITGFLRLLMGGVHTGQLPSEQPSSSGGYGSSRYGQ